MGGARVVRHTLPVLVPRLVARANASRHAVLRARPVALGTRLELAAAARAIVEDEGLRAIRGMSWAAIRHGFGTGEALGRPLTAVEAAGRRVADGTRPVFTASPRAGLGRAAALRDQALALAVAAALQRAGAETQKRAQEARRKHGAAG